jgi:hypothetical protein
VDGTFIRYQRVAGGVLVDREKSEVRQSSKFLEGDFGFRVDVVQGEGLEEG